MALFFKLALFTLLNYFLNSPVGYDPILKYPVAINASNFLGGPVNKKIVYVHIKSPLTIGGSKQLEHVKKLVIHEVYHLAPKIKNTQIQCRQFGKLDPVTYVVRELLTHLCASTPK